jgi:hypothetical protein
MGHNSCSLLESIQFACAAKQWPDRLQPQRNDMPKRTIRSFADLDAMRGKVDHVLTLFSGVMASGLRAF